MTKNRIKYPKVIFINNREAQADYYCWLAQEVVRRDFENRGFFVLPYLIPFQTKAVYFPDFSLSKKFWRLVRKSVRNAGEKFPSEATKIISPMVSKPLLKTYDIKNLWHDLHKIGFLNLNVNRITILLTPYGPGSSFSVRNDEIFLTFRADRNIADLPRSIISALVLLKNGGYQKAPEIFWKNKYYSEFIANETIIRKYCPSLNFSQLSKKDIAASKEYLLKLGVGQFKKINPNMAKYLSDQEKRVFTHLLSEQILPHDRMAEILWGERVEEKYSLWAMTKIIQKIRKKIRIAGGNPAQIKTIYGYGYGLA